MIDQDTIESIERGIELKKAAEKAAEEKKDLETQLQAELGRWHMKNQEFIQLTAAQLENELEKMKQPEAEQNVDIKSENMNEILADYKKQFGNEEWYEDPKVKEDGSVSLRFPSMEDAVNFFQDQAEKNRPFVVVDEKTKQVMAYSNGDGKLYHSDGNVFKPGDKLKPGGQSVAEFTMPTPGANMTAMQETKGSSSSSTLSRETVEDDLDSDFDEGFDEDSGYDDEDDLGSEESEGYRP